MIWMLLAWAGSPVVASPCAAPIRGALSCSSAIEDTLRRSDTSDMSGYDGRNCEGTFAQANAEHVYSFTCQKAGPVKLTLTGLSTDVDIYVLDSQCDPHRRCVGAAVAGGGNVDAVKAFTCEPGATYYIALEGFALGDVSASPYRLEFDLSGACVESCTDRVDNDVNGSIDCADAWCAHDPACSEVYCTNGLDDDKDGSVDCTDVDCASADGCMAALLLTPPTAPAVGATVPIHATLRVAPGQLPPTRVEVAAGGATIVLHDDGSNGDVTPGDGQWSGTWTPTTEGSVELRASAVGGSPTAPAVVNVEVGVVRLWGPAPTIVFTAPALGGCPDVDARCATATLDLAGSPPVEGGVARVDAAPEYRGAIVEIRLGDAWQPLPGADLPMSPGSPLRWDVRLRLDECCGEDRRPDETAALRLVAPHIAGELGATVSADLSADSFWHCWWRVVLTGIGACVLAWYAYGWTSPNGFARTLGLDLGRRADLEDASFYPIRQHRGTRSGWYRDARAYLCSSFAVRGHSVGRHPPDALVRVRAAGATVRMQPVAGQSIEWQDLDGGWVVLGPEEVLAPLGRVYRPAGSNEFFFSLRRHAG